jgi:hypothetical protein
MPCPRRVFTAHTRYHVTMGCNNRAFDLQRPFCSKAPLLCVTRAD